MSLKKKSNPKSFFRADETKQKKEALQKILALLWGLLRFFLSFIGYVLLSPFVALSKLSKFLLSKINRLLTLFKFSLSFKMGFMYSLMFILIFGVLTTGLFLGAKFFLLGQSEKILDQHCISIITQFRDAKDPSALDYQDMANRHLLHISLSEDGKNPLASWQYQVSYPQIFSAFHPLYLEDLNRNYLVFKNGRYYALRVQKFLGFERNVLALIFIISIVISLFGLSLTIAISGGLARKLLYPIKKMTDDAALISAHNLNKRLDVKKSKDELKELAVTFNALLDNIEMSYAKQKSFVSDASHELRTPIAIIQGYADLLTRWGKENPEILKEAIEAIQSEANDMKTLVNQLLFLSRSDEKRLAFQLSILDMAQQIETVFQEFKRIDTAHSYDYVESPPSALVIGDESAIRQVLRILLDNAQKYTPEGGQIYLSLFTEGQNLILCIKDTGIGIDKEDLPYIFDRFYRADKARQRKGGRGLGLSIAHEIISLHRGQIQVQSQKDKGTEIRLYLPLADI